MPARLPRLGSEASPEEQLASRGPSSPRASWLGPTGSVSLRAIIFCISASHGLIFPAPGCVQSDRWRRSINTCPGGTGGWRGRDAASDSCPCWTPDRGHRGLLSRSPPGTCCLFQLPARVALTCAPCLGGREPAPPPSPSTWL